jgi:hypothetical protein
VVPVVFVVKSSEFIESIFVKEEAVRVYERAIWVHVKAQVVVPASCRVSLVLLLIFEVTWLYELFWVLLNLWPNVA